MSATGYLVMPDAGEGRAVLVLGSWWGLGDAQREICDAFADAGYVALAPDLVGDGRTTDDAEVARAWLLERDPNVVADLVLSSAAILRSSNETPDAPIGVLGIGMGASWGLWLASRAPDQVGALSFISGTQRVDHLDVIAAVQGHFAEHDDLVDDDERVLLEAALHLDGTDVEFFDYPGTSAGFFEQGPNYDEAAATLVFERTLRLFDEHLRKKMRR